MLGAVYVAKNKQILAYILVIFTSLELKRSEGIWRNNEIIVDIIHTVIQKHQ